MSLDAIKRRVQIKAGFSASADFVEDGKPALFRADVVLAIPNVVMRPSLEDVQGSLNKCVQIVLKMAESVPQWQHLIQQQKQQQKVCTQDIVLNAVQVTAVTCSLSFLIKVVTTNSRFCVRSNSLSQT